MSWAVDWAPLEAVLPYEECAAWMYMGTVDEVPDCPPIIQYKHHDSRRYVNLALTDRGVQAFDVTFPGPTARSLPDAPAALLRARSAL